MLQESMQHTCIGFVKMFLFYTPVCQIYIQAMFSHELFFECHKAALVDISTQWL